MTEPRHDEPTLDELEFIDLTATTIVGFLVFTRRTTGAAAEEPFRKAHEALRRLDERLVTIGCAAGMIAEDRDSLKPSLRSACTVEDSPKGRLEAILRAAQVAKALFALRCAVDELRAKLPASAVGLPILLPGESAFLNASRDLAQWTRDWGAAPEESAETDERPVAPGRPRKPRATVNARMLEAFQQDPECAGWSSVKWAKHLHCAKSTVVATKFWKDLAMGRDRLNAERAADRRARTSGAGGAQRRHEEYRD